MADLLLVVNLHINFLQSSYIDARYPYNEMEKVLALQPENQRLDLAFIY